MQPDSSLAPEAAACLAARSCCWRGLFRALPLGTALLPAFCWKGNSPLSRLPFSGKPPKSHLTEKRHQDVININLDSACAFLKFQKGRYSKNYWCVLWRENITQNPKVLGSFFTTIEVLQQWLAYLFRRLTTIGFLIFFMEEKIKSGWFRNQPTSEMKH